MHQETEGLINGVIRSFETTRFPVFDQAGELYATCGVTLDVTEQRRVAAELIAAKDAAFAAELTASRDEALAAKAAANLLATRRWRRRPRSRPSWPR